MGSDNSSAFNFSSVLNLVAVDVDVGSGSDFGSAVGSGSGVDSKLLFGLMVDEGLDFVSEVGSGSGVGSGEGSGSELGSGEGSGSGIVGSSVYFWVVVVAFICENFRNFGAYFGLLGMNLGLYVVICSNFGVTD